MKQLSLEKLTPALLGNREVVRKHAQRDKESYQIQLNKIFVMQDFNGRKTFSGIEELKESILLNGQESPGTVIPLKNGTFALVKGERRYRALKLAEKEGHKDLMFRAFVSDKDISLDELYFQELSTQHVSKLLPDEVGGMLQKLLNLGYKQTQIATRIGKSQSYVHNMIAFCREDKDVKNAVTEGKISITAVNKISKEIKNKSERTKKIKEAVASKEGKIKVDDITGTNPREEKINRAAAEISILFHADSLPAAFAIVNILNKHF